MGENLNKLVVLFYSLFAISLPFNGNEIDIIGVSRFEIKITMITFIMLFAIWILVVKINGIKSKFLMLLNSKNTVDMP